MTRRAADRLAQSSESATGAITPTGSPFIYQNPSDRRMEEVIIEGGTVSAIAFSRDGSAYIACGFTSGNVLLNGKDYVKVTYTGTPTMTRIPR